MRGVKRFLPRGFSPVKRVPDPARVESDFIFLLNIRPEHDILLFSTRLGFPTGLDGGTAMLGTGNRSTRRSIHAPACVHTLPLVNFQK